MRCLFRSPYSLSLSIFFFIFFFLQFDILGCCWLHAFSLRLTKFPEFIDMLFTKFRNLEGIIIQTGRGHGNPLPGESSFLENPTDRGTWQETFHRVTKSTIRLSDLAQHIISNNFLILFSFNSETLVIYIYISETGP